jgi:zinc protease
MGARQQHDPGVASVSAVLSNDQSLAEARSIIIKVVEGLVSEPPTKEEVDRAKSRLVRAAEMEMANPQSVGLGLSEWAAMGDWRLLFLNRDRVKAVTPEDIVRVARNYFIESNRTVGEFIPTEKAERAAVPVAPSFTELFRDYKGGVGMTQGEAFDPTPANIESRIVRSRLANGMRVAMLLKKTRGGTISAVVELQFGDETSLANKSAIAQIAGSLLMRGTKNKSRQQIQDEMDKLNARISVTGGGGGGGAGGGRRGGGAPSTTGVADASASIDTASANLIPAMGLAVEMLREPAFTDTDFEQARAQRVAAIESTRTDPQTLAADTIQRHLSPFCTDRRALSAYHRRTNR